MPWRPLLGGSTNCNSRMPVKMGRPWPRDISDFRVKLSCGSRPRKSRADPVHQRRRISTELGSSWPDLRKVDQVLAKLGRHRRNPAGLCCAPPPRPEPKATRNIVTNRALGETSGVNKGDAHDDVLRCLG